MATSAGRLVWQLYFAKTRPNVDSLHSTWGVPVLHLQSFFHFGIGHHADATLGQGEHADATLGLARRNTRLEDPVNLLNTR